MDTLIAAMQQLQKTEGWKMLKEQMLHEQRRSFLDMTTAKTTDARAMAATEYTTLTRMMDAPEKVLEQAKATLLAQPK
ncbi:MAG TPA: hypothetical protein VHL57_07475 [Flavobacteriales bacterium]|nr:hypothetical protein [Flavobacteriales bacterium]